MRIRHATPAEMATPVEFTVTDPVGYVDDDQLRSEAAAGRMRPEWTWFAEDGGRVVARAVWWGRADSEHPLVLDCLHVLPDVPDRAALATELLTRAHSEFSTLNSEFTPEYLLPLRTNRDDPAVVWRVEAARAAGLSDVVERFRYEWTPASGVPTRSDRLTFRPATDEEFLAVFRRVAVGSLDAATRRDLTVMDPDAQARGDLEFYLSCPGDRSWWRLAETSNGGGVAGFAIPSATPYHRNVGYLGVLPERRGRGYVNDILAEITRFHATSGADRITATTDVSNTPMAAAFDRANYQVTEVRMVFTPSTGTPAT